MILKKTENSMRFFGGFVQPAKTAQIEFSLSLGNIFFIADLSLQIYPLYFSGFGVCGKQNAEAQ